MTMLGGASIKGRLQQLMQHILHERGYAIVSTQAPPGEVYRGNPRALGAHLDTVPRLVELPLAAARSGIARLRPGEDPYVTALAACGPDLDPVAARRTIRDALRAAVEPLARRTAAQRLGLEPGAVPALDERPPWVLWYPWLRQSLAERSAAVNREVARINRASGITLDAERGGTLLGGGEAKFEAEAERLARVLFSIREHGYWRHAGRDGDIIARVLIARDDAWCWLVSAGYHRLSVLAHLGHESVTVRVKGLVYECDAPWWPNVRFGEFPLPAAQQVFRNVLE